MKGRKLNMLKRKIAAFAATAAVAGALVVALPVAALAHDAAAGLKDATYTKGGTTEYFAVDVTDPDDPTKTISSEDDWFKADWTVKLDGTAVAYNENKTWTAGVDGYAFDKNKGQVLLDSDLFTKHGKAQAYALVISALNPDHADATATLKVNYYGTDTLTFRQIDASGKVVKTHTFTLADLKNHVNKKEGYRNETVCGMSHGVMFQKINGVLLSDLLADAGIEFKSGMTMKTHTNDNAAVYNTVDANSEYFNISWDDLYGTPRYEFPGLLKDMDTVNDLNDTLPHLGIKFREKVVASQTAPAYEKVPVEPIIAYGYAEKDLAGVISAGNVDCIANGEITDRMTDEKSFRVFWGMALTEDGKAITDEVTTAENSFYTFDIDFIEGTATHPAGSTTATSFDAMNELRALIEEASKLLTDNGVQYYDEYAIDEDPNGLLDKMPFGTYENAYLYFLALSNTSATDEFNNIEGVSTYGKTGTIRTPIYVLRNCKHFDYRINDSVTIMKYLLNAVKAESNVVTAADATLANGVAKPVISLNGKQLVEGTDYTATYENNTKVGTGTATIVGKGDYVGTAKVSFKVSEAAPAVQPATPAAAAKAANGLSVKAKKVTLKAKKLKKKAQKASALTIKGANGKVTVKIVKVNKKKFAKKFKIAANGKLTVAKKVKKGTYKLTVKVSAAGDATHAAADKTVTIKVKVK